MLASVNSFLVSTIETTFLNQSEPNLHEMLMGTRSRMSSIISKIRPVFPELLSLKYWKLPLLTIDSTFLYQSGLKLHKVFIGTRSRMSSIMNEICPVKQKLIALELLKIVVVNLVSMIETWFLYQSGPNLHEVFMGTRSPSNNMEVICPWMMENCVFNLSGAKELISQSIWIKVDYIYLVAISI